MLACLEACARYGYPETTALHPYSEMLASRCAAGLLDKYLLFFSGGE